MKMTIPILVTIVLIHMPWNLYGRQESGKDPVLEIFDKYEEKEGVESITISPALLGLMKNGKTNDPKTQELISKITGLRVLTMTDGVDGKNRTIREALVNDLQPVIKTQFEEIMKVKSSGEKIELYVRKTPECKDCKSALLFFTSSDASVTVMHLAGIIDKTMIDAVMNGEIGISK